MDRIFKFAEVMAAGVATVPKHLQGNVADCMAVVMQATQWEMNPFAVAQKTHVTQGGVLGYEAQLISAVVTARAPVKEQFHYTFIGDWSTVLGKVEERKSDKGGKYYVPTYKAADEVGLGVICSCTLKGETVPREMTVLMTQCFPRFSTQWATDPKQQICYVAVRKWSRLFAPGVILGVYADTELDDSAPAPRDMGGVELVPDPNESPLLQEARTAAGKGLDAFKAWFKTVPPSERAKLDSHRDDLEPIWVKADQSRTVETPGGTTPPRPAVTFASVMTNMNAAKNLDALYIAAEWIVDVPDAEERKTLEAKFDELKETF
jgi:hypothetical protein